MKQRSLLYILAIALCACTQNSRNIPFPENNEVFTSAKSYTIAPANPVKVKWINSAKGTPKARVVKTLFEEYKEPTFNYQRFHPLKAAPDSNILFIKDLPSVSFSIKDLKPKKIKPSIVLLGKPKKTKSAAAVPEPQSTFGLVEFGQDQGLSGTVGMSIAQDKNKCLWIGTDYGLCFYNGEYFYTWFKHEGLSRDSKHSVCVDSRGHVWAAGGGIDELLPEEGILKHYGKEEGLATSAVASVYENTKKQICIATREGLDIFDPKEETIVHIGKENGMLGGYVNQVIEDHEGRLWMATNGGGVSIYDPKAEKIYNLTDKQKLSNNDIRAILEDKDGNIWMGGWNGGVDMFDHKKGVFYHLTEATGICDHYIRSLMQDKNNNIWIGCLSGGIDVYDPALRNIYHFSGQKGMVKSDARCLFEDKEGCIWIGSNGGGLQAYNPNNGTINNFNTKWRSAKAPAHTFLEDTEGNYWIGTVGLGTDVYDPHKPGLKHLMNEDWTDGYMNQILDDKNGHVWSCTDYRLNCFDKKTSEVASWNDNEGLIHNQVKCFIINNTTELFLGSGGGLDKMDMTSRTFQHLESDLNSSVSCMMHAADGKVWLGTYSSGMYVFDPKNLTLQHFGKAQGFSNNIIYDILADNEGYIWIASGGDGLKKIDPRNNSVSDINADNGLAEMSVFSLIEKEKKIYAGTEKGLSVISVSPDNKIEIRNYGKPQGFLSTDFNNNSTLLDSKGRLWWGIGEVITVFDPVKQNSFSNSTAITAIGIMGKELDFKDNDKLKEGLQEKDTVWTPLRDTFYFKKSLTADTGYLQHNSISWKGTMGQYHIPADLELPYHQDHITFHFTGNYLSNADKTSYRYILEGIDHQWNPIVDKAFADYRNLPPGNYTFKVSSNNFNGPWSEPAQFSFTITPPWWKTGLAYGVYALFFIGLVFGYNRLKTHQLLLRQKELELNVEERTVEIVKQKSLVEEKQKEIVDSINYAKRIQYTLLAHEKVMKKHFADHFVMFQPKDIVSGDFYWATKKIVSENEKELFYLAVCDSTGHGVPGAFMSLLNISFLNEAINEKNILQPDEILNYVRERLVKSISRDGGQDGMDGILLCVETDTKNKDGAFKVTYAAGNNCPLLFQNNALTELPANKMPIGKGEKDELFSLYTINADKGDTIYLYTDGFADQFGGPQGKKFKYRKLNDLLLNNATQNMDKQGELLLTTLNDWKGGLEQVDDVCIIGIRL